MNSTYESIVKKRYPKIYDIEDVKTFVKAGKLTAEEFKRITGEDYAE